MLFVEKPKTYNFHFPSNIAIICAEYENQINLMTAAWHTQVSQKPPLYMVSISPQRYTHELIVYSREFSINFISYDLSQLAAFLGRTSGRDIEKVSVFDVALEQSVNIRTPFLKKAYAIYECKLYDYRRAGDHTLFIGQIVGVHYDENSFDPDLKTSPTLYLGSDKYATLDTSSVKIHSEKQVKDYLSKWVQDI
ncbi:MAG: flavin reductase family protein [Thermotogaceae bacterium]|nr:flavin reductase family protein [Thermotogaceae bacterium]